MELISILLNASVDKIFFGAGVLLIIMWLTGGFKPIVLDKTKSRWSLNFGIIFIVLGMIIFFSPHLITNKGVTKLDTPKTLGETPKTSEETHRAPEEAHKTPEDRHKTLGDIFKH